MAEQRAVAKLDIQVELAGLCFAYPGRQPVLDKLNFILRRGQRIGLIGPNGSGKSTLLHLIMGLLQPRHGIIKLFGREVREEKDFRDIRNQIGFVFQHADDQLFSPTVIEDVAFGLLNMGKKPAEAIELSKRALQSLGLEGFEDRITHKLSGGEKKLVSFATVLVMEPQFLLLDEPTTGLDEETVEKMIAVLNDLDIGYLTVSHEYDFLSKTTDDIYCMKAGRIDFSCKSDQIHGRR